jgi:hypothetical protein
LVGIPDAFSTPGDDKAGSIGGAEEEPTQNAADFFRSTFIEELNVEREARQIEAQGICPNCQKSKIIPILYGFPSNELVTGMKWHKLELGKPICYDGLSGPCPHGCLVILCNI